MSTFLIARPWMSHARGVIDLLRHFPTRLREPAFWGIQAGIAGVTALHTLSEAAGLASGHHGFLAQVHHLPVTFYLLPVVAACYRYGMEGGVLSGAWCAILTVPNMVLWHTANFEWLGELVFVMVVVVIGLVVASLVERERAHREQAEVAGHRLAFLNDAAATLSDTPHLAQAVERALAQLVSTLGLRGASVVATDTFGEESVRAVHATLEADERLLATWAAGRRPGISHQGTWAVPVITHGREVGHLTALAAPDHTETAEENALLSAVAGQIGVAIDNAGLHRQEERRLRSYVQQVTRSQEEERHRIARELHDETVQQLIVLARDLNTTAEECPQPALRERLHTVHGHTQEILAGLRRFSRDLRPALLDQLGLGAALEWITNDLRDRRDLRATFTVSGTPERLPEDIEVTLYRIAQEALRNADRHANAETVAVSARFDPTEVEVSVVDDGAGFAVPKTNGLVRPTTLGLLGMQERARLVGGSLSVVSQPGAGTDISVRVPIS